CCSRVPASSSKRRPGRAATCSPRCCAPRRPPSASWAVPRTPRSSRRRSAPTVAYSRSDKPREPSRRSTRPAAGSAAATRSGGRDVLVLEGFPGGPARSVLLRVDGQTGNVEGTALRFGSAALDIVPTGDGRRVFVPSPLDDVTQEIDVASMRVMRRYPAGGIAGALSPDGGALALGSDDGRVRLLDLPSGRARLFTGRHR